VDTHAAFVAKGKGTALYRDNIHPNDIGSRLVARTLFDAYLASALDSGFQTPSWPRLAAANLIGNGDFIDWSSAIPTGWGLIAPGSAIKTTEAVFFSSFASCLALYANGNQAARLTRYFRNSGAAVSPATAAGCGPLPMESPSTPISARPDIISTSGSFRHSAPAPLPRMNPFTFSVSLLSKETCREAI